jgi:hypothetical protein
MEWVDLMSIEKNDMLYIINQKIKALNGKKQLIIDGNSADSDTESDIDLKIEALTNILEML